MRILTTVLFACLLLVAQKVTCEEDYDESDLDLDIEVGPFNPSKEDQEAVMKTFRQYVNVRSTPTGERSERLDICLKSSILMGNDIEKNSLPSRSLHSPFKIVTLKMVAGRYTVEAGQEYLIKTDNFPSPYADNLKERWIFIAGSGVSLMVECPAIRIQSSRKCDSDRLTIFKGKRFRKGIRRCGFINNFSREFTENIKIVFRSNSDNKQGYGFFCKISANVLPTTTTVPTTHSPGCPQLLQPSNPVSVSTCGDLTAEYSSHCQCSECNGEIILDCEFCTYCDFNIFAMHTFTKNIVLGASFQCDTPIDTVTDTLFHSTISKIVGLKLCAEQDIAHIHMPVSQFTQLKGLYYQDCNVSDARACVYDPCSTTDVCELNPGVTRNINNPMKRNTRTTYSITLPSVSDVPNLTELYLAEVDMTLTSAGLPYTNLEKFCFNSADGTVSPNAFQSLTALTQVYVEVCQTTLENQDFAMQSSSLDCLEIVDQCTNDIQNLAITLDAGCNPSNTTVSMTVNKALLPFIAICPFNKLVQTNCVHLNWKTETDCRTCLLYWLWKIPSQYLDTVSNMCTVTDSDPAQDLSNYVANNALLSMCNYFPMYQCT